MTEVRRYEVPGGRYVYRLYNNGALWLTEWVSKSQCRISVLVPACYVVRDSYV